MLDQPDQSAMTEPDAKPAALHSPDADHVAKLRRWATAINIAEDDEIDKETLSSIGQKVTQEYQIDLITLADWRCKTEKAEKIANQIAEQKTYPWPKASNVLYPLITTACIQFAARAYPAIISGRNVVKGSVIGSDDGVPLFDNGKPMVDPQTGAPVWATPPGAKKDRATRVGDHMSFQLLDEQTEWEPETDKLLHVLPMVGTAFRKVFFDADKRRNASLYVSAMSLVINYHARSLERAPRITEEISFYPHEIEEKVRAGVFLDIDYPQAPNADGDVDAPIEFLEQHRWYDLDGDGFREPYVVTVHKQSSEVVRIVARYDVDGIQYNRTRGKIQKIEPIHYYQAYLFLPNFEFKGSIYGTGFGQLLLPMNESINTTLNMLIDAGHLANTQGGFIGKGLSMNAGSLKFQPGEYKQVNSTGASIRDNIVQNQFGGPSPVLFQLLGMLIEAGKEIASVKDVLTGENQQPNTPATTTLAMIEQGLKVFTSIYKRVYRALKGELTMLYRLNRIYLDQEASYKVGDDWRQVTRADYEKGSGVEPVSDPSMVSDMQKLGRAQFLMQFATDPEMNGREIKERMLDAAGIDNIDKLFNPNPPPNPAILAKAAELHTRQLEAESRNLEAQANVELKKAQALYQRAAAINQFAQADKAVGQMNIAFVEHELEAIRTMMEAMGQGQQAQAAAPGGDDSAAPAAPATGGPTRVAAPPQLAPGATGPDAGSMPASPGTFLAAARGGDTPG